MPDLSIGFKTIREKWFQSSSTSEPVPDTRCCPPRFMPLRVSILEHERTRARLQTFDDSEAKRKFQSSSTSEPVPDHTQPRSSVTFNPFQSSSTSEPVPDDNSSFYALEGRLFQSSSTSEPVPDFDDLVKGRKQAVSILEHERTRARLVLLQVEN